ncbi:MULTISPECIES: endonuclease [Microvirgula]|uniref:Endonuclease n=1 Tax=Microvirgula aerodenitrificans TaxID=57480 RepID=A0A2S0P879_9NEIS|nr:MULTISPECIES: endonuclease [Microvirgula]AVY93599.1 endonuclease [Microvirgula aerodenitrificans]RAS20139.1 deoxyribonuclease-1 [Microvirgula sp. AG722]
MSKSLFLFAACCVATLAACSEQQARDLAHGAIEEGSRLISEQVGEWLGKTLDGALTPAADPSEPQAVELVSGNKAVGHRNFVNAKKILPRIYAGMEEDFYCGCRYSGKEVDATSCGYRPRKNAERGQRIEWEHVVPAWVLGHQRQCWQNGGRKQCTSSDPLFRMAEGDLVNLVPAVGEVNGDRSNFPYSVWARNPAPVYGSCRTVVDFRLRRVQPREEVRGRIARIQLYMHQRYRLRLSSQDRKLFCAWANAYPVDDWELRRNERLVRWQGEGNPLVGDTTRLAALCAAG